MKDTEQHPLPPSVWAVRKSTRAFTVAVTGVIMGVTDVCIGVFRTHWRLEWLTGLLFLVISAAAAVAGSALRRHERLPGGTKGLEPHDQPHTRLDR